jgi:hypothetical protein
MLIVSFLPLFDRYFDAGRDRFVEIDIWDTKSLLRVAGVCKAWRQAITSFLWQTYNLPIIEKEVPLEILTRNIHLVRNDDFLFDKQHKKHAPLQGAWALLRSYRFMMPCSPVKTLIGSKKPHTLLESSGSRG